MNEYLLGNIFGITQTIIGYPFDTLKTNLQNSKPIKHYLKTPMKLYTGVNYPLALSCISGGLLFGNYDYFYRKTDSRFAAGILTGFVSACLITPFDYFKIQLQTNGHLTSITSSITPNRYNLSLSLFKKSYAGLSYTVSRELVSIPVYFGVFHYLDTKFTQNFENTLKKQSKTDTEALLNTSSNNVCVPSFIPSIVYSGIAGGVAGMSSWLITYPLDTLKTRKQLNPDTKFKQLVKSGHLFNGIYITLLRAFIVNGLGFMIYKYVKY